MGTKRRFGDQRLVRNETGETLEEGMLVYVSGWNDGEERFLIAPATPGENHAAFILRGLILNENNGRVYTTHRMVGLNTSGAQVGDAVYLAADGAWTLTPGGQAVGYVVIVDAEQGVVMFDVRDIVSAPSSGEQRIRLLGPFRITKDTTNIAASGGHVIVDAVIPAGAVVLDIGMRIVETWGFAEGSIFVGAKPVAEPAVSVTLKTYASTPTFAIVPTGEVGRVEYDASDPLEKTSHLPGFVLEDCNLFVWSSETPDDGVLDVYAFIAEPVENGG